MPARNVLITAALAGLIVTVPGRTAACTGPVADLKAGLTQPPVDGMEIEAALRGLSPEQQTRIFFPSQSGDDFVPVQVLVNGRWSSKTPDSLGGVPKGQRVRLLGRYAGPVAHRSGKAGYLLIAPPDTCGGGAAVGLDRSLNVARNWVIVEGSIAEGKAGSIGRYHELLPLRLTGAKLVAEGRAALDYVIHVRK